MLRGDFLLLFKLLFRQSFFTRTSECLLRMLSKLKVFSDITFKSLMIVQTFHVKENNYLVSHSEASNSHKPLYKDNHCHL